MESAVNMRRDSDRIQGSAFMCHVFTDVQVTHVIWPPQNTTVSPYSQLKEKELFVALIKQQVCMSILCYAWTLGWSHIYLNTSLF